MELPQINYPKYRGKKYRYAYAVCDFNFIDGEKVCACHYFLRENDLNLYICIQLVKLDVTTKTRLIWSEKDCFPSEPVFVAAPDAEEEDEGDDLCTIFFRHKSFQTSALFSRCTGICCHQLRCRESSILASHGRRHDERNGTSGF